MRSSIVKIFLIVGLSTGISCEKLVDPGFPATQLSREAVFSNDLTATSALLAVYTQLEASLFLTNLTNYTGLSADEFSLNSPAAVYQDIYNNNIVPGSNLTDPFWESLFYCIYECNSIIEGVRESKLMTESTKKQLDAEARFLRGFCNFQLVNIYGGIPIITSSDYQTNARIAKSEITEIYKFIERDFLGALQNISADYVSPAGVVTMERVRANQATVKAYLAKLYLYMNNWVKAEEFSNEIISDASRYSMLSNLTDVFLKNSKEQIWQVMPVFKNYNTYTAYNLILFGPPSTVYLDRRLVASFSATDKRRSSWIGMVKSGIDSFYFAYKYKVYQGATLTEYSSMIRLAEVYLIRSEARARLNNLTLSLSDLNVVRQRAGIGLLPDMQPQALIDSLIFERKRELFSENGNRWFDLKRLGLADSVLGRVKGTNWSPTDALYPIPIGEMQKNPLLNQNPGY